MAGRVSVAPLDWDAIVANWDDVLASSRKVIVRSLRLGIPNRHRAKVWSLLTGAEKWRGTREFEYAEAVARPTMSQHIIDCDVPRTFPALPEDEKQAFMRSLRNVLVAYSNVDPEIGYVQGMSFLAAMFVRRQDEETAFWSFYGLMYHADYREFFVPGFPKLTEMTIVVDQLLTERYPAVLEALVQNGFNSILFCPGWFNTCFVASELDSLMIAFLWDQFLAFGICALLSFGMASVSFMTDVLKKEGYSGLLSVATNPGKILLDKSTHEVNIALVREWITPVKLAELTRRAFAGAR
jgi:hypothetical protein